MTTQDPGTGRRGRTDLAEEALRHVRCGRLHQAAAVLGRAPHGHPAPGRQVHEVLLGAVGRCWTRGWQPLDLVHAAARASRHTRTDLLRTAVLQESLNYPASTLDPRWHAQLEALDAQGARPDPRGTEVGRGDLVPALVLVLVLDGLPSLPSFVARPGTARGRGARPHDVDARVLERVRALLAKAEATPFEAEAETFTAGAQALMARHALDRAMLDAGQGDDPRDRARPEGVRVLVAPPYEDGKTTLLARIAAVNRCRAVWFTDLGHVSVVGHRADLRTVELLFTSLLVQVTEAMRRHGPQVDRWGRSRTRRFRSSFLAGFAQRIGERLEAEVRGQVAAVEAGSRGGLLPVLAAREAEVTQMFDALFPDVDRAPGSRQVRDPEGWSAGRAAADLASTAAGAPVGA